MLPPRRLQRPSKPAWALSCQEADAQQADAEAQLLGFVEGLDFGGYVEELDARLVGGQQLQAGGGLYAALRCQARRCSCV
jgi:hypothetical protein